MEYYFGIDAMCCILYNSIYIFCGLIKSFIDIKKICTMFARDNYPSELKNWDIIYFRIFLGKSVDVSKKFG